MRSGEAFFAALAADVQRAIEWARPIGRLQLEIWRFHLLTPDAAYVVTRSVATTQWRDGRTQGLPTVEAAVMARQGGRWRVVYKRISWREPAPERQRSASASSRTL